MHFHHAVVALSLSIAISALPTVERSTTINWRLCPEVLAEVEEALGIPDIQPFECATLSVPLDYTNSYSGDLDLALIRVNATKTPVLGTILFNPGGPGGTGIENLAIAGPNLVEILGGQYHVVSWDPRGTGKTLPFDCKLTKPLNRRRDVGTLVSTNLTERFLQMGWQGAKVVADTCYARMNSTGELIGTAFTARDMVEIIDALGEDRQLRYWGLSYGTQLGATFAAMFPERVERMLLDGNMNPHDYQAGHYGNFVHDADKAFLAFLEECALSKEHCSLVQFTGLRTAQDLLELINTQLIGPLATNATKSIENWAAYAAAKGVLYQTLYFPNSWPRFADLVTSILNGSLTDVTPPPSLRKPYDLGVDSLNGIRCGDALWRASAPEEILDQVRYQATISDSFSDMIYDSTWTCAAWKMRAKEQYKGDFKVKTKHPILLVNGPYDPVTPLVSAFNSSAGFEGSVVLRHNGYGHGLASHPSLCTAKAVQTYFKEGILPAVGTKCEPDVLVWDLLGSSNKSSDRRRDAMSEEDLKLLNAMQLVGRSQALLGAL